MNLISVLFNIYQKFKFGPAPNLIGDRDVEYSFVLANLSSKKGHGAGKEMVREKAWVFNDI